MAPPAGPLGPGGEGGSEQQGPGQAEPAGEARPEAAREPPTLSPLGLRLPAMKDTSMEQVGQSLSKVIDTLDGQLDPRRWGCSLEPPDQSFRTEAPEGAPLEGLPSGGCCEGAPSPMVFYHFALEGPSPGGAGGGHHDPAGNGQPAHVPGGPEAAGQEKGGGGGGAAGSTRQAPPGPVTGPPRQEEEEEEAAANAKALGEGKASPSLSSAEDSGVEEGQGSPSEAAHPSEFRWVVTQKGEAPLTSARGRLQGGKCPWRCLCRWGQVGWGGQTGGGDSQASCSLGS